jgi:hypothetical protein
MSRTYQKFMARLQNSNDGWEVDKSVDMSEVFDAQKSQCDNSTRWTTVYRQRTEIRINLVGSLRSVESIVTPLTLTTKLFHLAAQRESRTTTQIATATSRVAEQTQRDSASMITMATVTTLFLPGTFISAVLSTTVFDYKDDDLSVSTKWWVLPASMIPMTVVLAVSWWMWRKWRLNKLKDEMTKQMSVFGDGGVILGSK